MYHFTDVSDVEVCSHNFLPVLNFESTSRRTASRPKVSYETGGINVIRGKKKASGKKLLTRLYGKNQIRLSVSKMDNGTTS